jgi:hypothetical protein
MTSHHSSVAGTQQFGQVLNAKRTGSNPVRQEESSSLGIERPKIQLLKHCRNYANCGISTVDIEGVSMLYTFDQANANAPSKRDTQYFEMVGNRAIYHDGWIAATTPPSPLGASRRIELLQPSSC